MDNKYDYYYDEEKNQIVYYNDDKEKNNLVDENYRLDNEGNGGVKKKSFFRSFVAPLAVLAVVGSLFFGAGITWSTKDLDAKIQEAVDNVATKDNVLNLDSNKIVPTANGETSSNTVQVVENVSKAVVSINTKSESTSTYFGFGGGINIGAGSGVIIYEDDGKIYIVTNNHVIEDAKQVTISIDDDKQVPAKFVGAQAEDDIAVISVAKSDMIGAGIDDYAIATFANSDNIKVGQDVVAIGNAAGEGKSATKGIISAVDKEIAVEGTKLEVIQTDAAINPGNSGGALVNMQSQIVGINTAKYSSGGALTGGTIEGMGYSIPSNKVKILVEQMISGNHDNTNTEKPLLGIQGQNLTDEIRETYNVPLGAYVVSVSENSNIAKAGLRAGDVIVQVNDKKVSTIEDVSNHLGNYKVGDLVTISIYRDGSTFEINSELQDYNTLNRF